MSPARFGNLARREKINMKVHLYLVIGFALGAGALQAHAGTVKSHYLQIFSASDDRWFMTSNSEEITQVITYRKEFEQNTDEPQVHVFNEQAKGIVPLLRYVHNKSGDHFFTTDANEGATAVQAYGYASEGICCYIAPTQLSGTVPMYRLLKGNKHRYVTSVDARDKATFEQGWKLEGIAGYVWSMVKNPSDQSTSLPTK